MKANLPGLGLRSSAAALATITIWLALLLSAPAASAESAAPDSARQATTAAASDEMQQMASAMKDMAEMCRMMMQREMSSRPFLMIAGAVVGILLAVALLLLVVLEIQWIRFFALRIKSERQRLKY